MNAVRKLAVVLITTLTVLGFMTPQALAAAPDDFVDDPAAELLPADFCGDIVNFPVLADHYSSGTEHITTHGSGPLYFEVHFRDIDTFTNTLNGKTFTVVNSGTDKDLDIVDNGDGTLTITVKVVFRQLVYAPDGSLLFRTAGQFRTRETIDTNGTLTDPSDDVPVDGTFSSVKDFVGHDGTAGRDFCQDLAIYIG
jgi:hypothetical protein